MKISLILMAVLFAVLPVLGLSAPSASAEEVVSYPDTLSAGDTIYFNPNLVITLKTEEYISYSNSIDSGAPYIYFRFDELYSDEHPIYNFVCGYVYIMYNTMGGSVSFPFYFYSSDTRLIGVNLNTIGSMYPNRVITESDISKPLFLLSSFILPSEYVTSTVSFSDNTFSLDSLVFSLDPTDFLSSSEESFIGIWGETAEFVGDIFIQVGDLFYDDTAEELTPIGTLAVILAGIAVVLLVWNLIRSFLPMRG